MQKSSKSCGSGLGYRIGIDARALSVEVSGIGRYNAEVLSRLVEMGHEWFLYSNRPLTLGDWDRPNVRIRTAGISHAYLRMLWAQTVMPWWASQDRLDLFWSPLHRLPLVMPPDLAQVVTIHDLVWKHAGQTMRPLNRWLDKTLMPLAVRAADRVIAVSESTACDIKREMPSEAGKILTIPLGASELGDPGSMESLAALGLSGPYFLFVGTLEPRKNLGRLLEAWSRLPPASGGGAVLAVVGGEGWGGVNVSAMVTALGLKDRVRVLGFVNDQQLSSLYTHALFLAMPSLYEGFGLPILEATSRGVPVLTSNTASMPEVAGDAGCLVSPLDVESIAVGIAQMLEDPKFRVELARRALVSAQRYSWDSSAQRTMAVFDEVITSRRAGGGRIQSNGSRRLTGEKL
jgi:glycosyltransferase involved in cell wall biosynthesis